MQRCVKKCFAKVCPKLAKNAFFWWLFAVCTQTWQIRGKFYAQAAKWGNFPPSLSNFSGSNDVAHPRDCFIICRKQGAWWVFVWRSYLIKRICDSSVWHEWLWAFLSYRLVALVICIKFCKIIATSFCRWLPVFQCSLMQKCTCTVCYRTSGSALVRWLT